MASVALQGITGEADRKAVLDSLPSSKKDGDMPVWAEAMANSMCVLKRYLAQRNNSWKFFDATDHYTTLFTLAAVVQSGRCRQFAMAALRELGHTDEQITNVAAMVASVHRNQLLTRALGVELETENPSPAVDLPALDDSLADDFEIVPDWARALMHTPATLKRILGERKNDLGIDSERWYMTQFALGTVSSHQCINRVARVLKSRFNWGDAKLVEFATMIATQQSDSVLFGALDVDG